MLERRKNRRLKSKLLITAVYQDERGRIATYDSIFSEDISAGGLKLVFPFTLPRDRILDLKVFLFSDPIALPAQGRVVWSDTRKELRVALSGNKGAQKNEVIWVGIEFINIDSFTRERILRWIKEEFGGKETQ